MSKNLYTVLMLSSLIFIIFNMNYVESFVTAPICDPGWVYESSSGQCFRFFNEYLDYHNASTYCDKFNAQMASLKTSATYRFLDRLAWASWWLPLQGDDSTGTWRWDDGSVATWTAWGPGQPGGAHWGKCVGTDGGQWYNFICNHRMHVVCQRPPPPPCGPGWTWREQSGDCVLLLPQPLPHNEANKTCQGLNSKLPMPKDETINSYLFSFINGSYPIWLGLTRVGTTLRWQDGEEVTWTNWYPRQPEGHGDCVYMRQNDGLWIDLPCTHPLYTICQQQQLTTKNVTTTTIATTNTEWTTSPKSSTTAVVDLQCPPGSFNNASSPQCQPCPRGSYQPLAGQAVCLTCGGGWMTNGNGSTSVMDCVAGAADRGRFLEERWTVRLDLGQNVVDELEVLEGVTSSLLAAVGVVGGVVGVEARAVEGAVGGLTSVPAVVLLDMQELKTELNDFQRNVTQQFSHDPVKINGEWIPAEISLENVDEPVSSSKDLLFDVSITIGSILATFLVFESV